MANAQAATATTSVAASTHDCHTDGVKFGLATSLSVAPDSGSVTARAARIGGTLANTNARSATDTPKTSSPP